MDYIPPCELYTGTSRSPDDNNFAGPHVTSVGGTTGNPEVSSRFSGGGFSRFFTVEDYQKDDVDAYISNFDDEYRIRYACVRSCAYHSPFLLCDLCRPAGGRGVPDIAALAQKYTFIYNQKEKVMESTVCSTSVRLTLILRSSLPIFEHLAKLR